MRAAMDNLLRIGPPLTEAILAWILPMPSPMTQLRQFQSPLGIEVASAPEQVIITPSEIAHIVASNHRSLKSSLSDDMSGLENGPDVNSSNNQGGFGHIQTCLLLIIAYVVYKAVQFIIDSF
jgi:hypothetical protein